MVLKNWILHHGVLVGNMLHGHGAEVRHIWLKIARRLRIQIHLHLLFDLLLYLTLNQIKTIPQLNQVLLKNAVIHSINLAQSHKTINHLAPPQIKPFSPVVRSLVLYLQLAQTLCDLRVLLPVAIQYKILVDDMRYLKIENDPLFDYLFSFGREDEYLYQGYVVLLSLAYGIVQIYAVA